MVNKTLLSLCCFLIMGMVIFSGCTSEKKIATPATVPVIKPVDGELYSPVCSSPVSGKLSESPNFSSHFTATELLTRPTSSSVTVSLVPKETMEIFFEYGTSLGSYACQTPAVPVKAGSPVNITIQGLMPDTQNYYRTCYRVVGSTVYQCGPDHSFHTQRSSGSGFTFDIQADSHLDEHASGELYNLTLAAERADQPDFLIDLGDTSMTEKLPTKTTDAIRDRYLLQRSHLGTVGDSVPLFLVLGNHDGEMGYALGGKDNRLALLSLQFRKMYFPNPEPDAFYTGNSDNAKDTGLRQDYYSWQWGDARFIVLDPFWYTTSKPGGNTDGWAWTLGKTQYQWLKETLETKKAKYTFVFSHHLVGGAFPEARGGIEYASLYEWGGNNPDGSYGFDQHRPGWGVPIRQLLVENNVTAFFHGHDHLFARQELDGITYQDVPQPATPGSPNPGAEYGYVSGTMLPSPGHLKITVGSESARVDYIGSALPGDKRNAAKNGAVVYTYTLLPWQISSGG